MASGRMPIENAPAEGRALLGVLLAQRRKELGYTHWPAFARDRLPLTPMGNPNTRMLADIERAYRKRFPGPTLRQLARAYRVTYDSVIAVAHCRADALVPVVPDRLPDGWRPPIADKAERDADAPYAAPIMERLLELAGGGVTDPSGPQVFPHDPDDAYAWDDPRTGGRFAVRDRVWFIADIRRRAAARAGGTNAGTAGA